MGLVAMIPMSLVEGWSAGESWVQVWSPLLGGPSSAMVIGLCLCRWGGLFFEVTGFLMGFLFFEVVVVGGVVLVVGFVWVFGGVCLGVYLRI